MPVPIPPRNSPSPLVPLPPLAPLEAVVVKHRPTSDTPDKQDATIRAWKGRYSHEDDLPLKVRVTPGGWFGRRITVTTTEDVWYRGAYDSYIKALAGFSFDLGSIPRILWWFISPWDIALESLFHDLGYREQRTRRRTVDQLFLSMMEDRGKPWYVRWPVYLGVRIGGWKSWNEHAARNKAEKLAARAAEEAAAAAASAADAKAAETVAETATAVARELAKVAQQSSLAADVTAEVAQQERDENGYGTD